MKVFYSPYCLLFCFLWMGSVVAWCQQDSVSTKTNASVTMVYLEHCETLSFDEANLPETQVLKGNVRFRHDSALLYCDSAYFYEKRNSLDAFGHVRIVQADTLVGHGDKLFYDGNRKLARFRRNVRLEDGKMTLYTDSLNYDRLNDIAYYYAGGRICDTLNTLTSRWGQYLPSTNRATFKNDVRLENEDFVLVSDTLNYNTQTNVADIVGPTSMYYQKKTTIYSTRGWYNTQNDLSMLLDKSIVVHEDGKSITGDSIFYDQRNGWGEVFGDMELIDSVQHVTLCGNYGYYDEKREDGMATDSALLVDWSSVDTMYMHADTMFIAKDTLGQTMRAYYNVRLYKVDMQVVCDSMVYTEHDSIIRLFNQPLMWNEGQQVSANQIDIFLKDSTIDRAHLKESAFVVRQVDSIRFDQMSGKEIYAYMKEGQMHQVAVNGNAETVFFPKEEDGSLLGVNMTQSSYVNVFMKDGQVDKVVLTAASNGTMYPLDYLPKDKTYLSGYFWAEQERPKHKMEVFSRPPKTPRTGTATTSEGTLDKIKEGKSAKKKM